MSDTLKLGIMGCGDLLRWQADGIKPSKNIAVSKLYDPQQERAETYATELGGTAVDGV